MEFVPKKIALCSTFYPGVEPFLRNWYTSVLQQTDRDYQLWIALDGIGVDRAVTALGKIPDSVVWITAEKGETPAAIRQRLLSQVVEEFDSVVLVDSDDILHPGRIAAARHGLCRSELVGCALRLVDQQGGDLGKELNLPPQISPNVILPRHNVFGLSNTAWRSSLLKKCLPVPSTAVIVDWFLATRAWLLGASLYFDQSVCMDYRQYASNSTRVCGPFSHEQVIHDTLRVSHHFQLILSSPIQGAVASRQERLLQVAEDVNKFASNVIHDQEKLDLYLVKLDELDLPPLWWSCVAHPSLKYLWSD